jgi:N-acyl-phosphatidylethanolamine-hydrolysing phospholipase D
MVLRPARLTMPDDADHRPPHHRAHGFQNNYLEFSGRSLADVLRWRWAAARQHLPPPPRQPTPQVAPDLAFVQANARAGAHGMQPAVTWLGHASTLVQLGGLSLLLDPVFSDRVSPVPFAGPRRHQPPGMALGQLPHIDAVLVSHNHYDHLDDASLRALARQPGGAPLVVVPLGLRGWCAARGLTRVAELDWWQSTELAGVQIALVPAQHWSARGLGDRMKTLWGGFAVFSPHCHLFYSGDTGYSKDFSDIRARYAERQAPQAGGGFDLALLPIGAYAPRWFMREQHIDAHEAVQVHRDIGAKRSLGIHWGTFQLTDEALDEPPRALAAARAAAGLAEHEFFVMAIGQTHVLPPRQGGTPGSA